TPTVPPSSRWTWTTRCCWWPPGPGAPRWPRSRTGAAAPSGSHSTTRSRRPCVRGPPPRSRSGTCRCHSWASSAGRYTLSRERIAAAFAAAPRPAFLPEHLRAQWQLDCPLPLTHGQTNSQPSTVAAMLELLDVAPGMKVLDVGSGSGWTTALLAELVGPQGRVIGVERVPALVEHGRAALRSGDWPQAEIRPAEHGRLGLPDEAPFDRILVSAMAGTLPTALVDQLAEEGVMVVPVDGRMTRVLRRGPGAETT